jgi:hypothetical protein
MMADPLRYLSEASGIRVVVATTPLSLFHQYQTESGTKNQRARDFLTHELDLITGEAKLSWQLRYHSVTATYFLSIHRVKQVQD